MSTEYDEDAIGMKRSTFEVRAKSIPMPDISIDLGNGDVIDLTNCVGTKDLLDPTKTHVIGSVVRKSAGREL